MISSQKSTFWEMEWEDTIRMGRGLGNRNEARRGHKNAIQQVGTPRK